MKTPQPYILFWDEVDCGQTFGESSPKPISVPEQPEENHPAIPPVWVCFAPDGTPRPFLLRSLE